VKCPHSGYLMNIIEFIYKVLIEEIRQIQQGERHAYLSFGLISQGIELLGSLIDKDDFNTKNLSGKRFNAALKEFFGREYHKYATDRDDFNLYANLRCGMLHVLFPQKKLLLGERKFDQHKYKHLEKYIYDDDNERLFLMAEDFYEDFRCACKKVIDIINDKSIFTKYPDLVKGSTIKKEIIELKRNLITIDI